MTHSTALRVILSEQKRSRRMRKAQSTIEYALLIAIVAAAFLAMNLYVQRAVQANFKLIEDQVNAEPE